MGSFKTILFYSSVKDKSLFYTQSFYQIDIDILKDLGYTVVLSNKITDALKFWKYNCVFAYFYRWSFFVALIAKIFGRNTYFTGGIDALNKSTNSKKNYFVQVLFFYLCHLVAKKCIIVSNTDMQHVNYIVGKSKKLVYSEHTVKTSNFINDFDPILKNNDFVTICWQGDKSNIERKGVDLALVLFSNLIKKAEFRKSNFYILGRTGNGTHYLSQIIESLGLKERVFIIGEVSEEEKIEYLTRNKFYFQLSQYEGFGIAALEALLSGDIIIHSGQGGLSNKIFKKHIEVDIYGDIEKLSADLYKRLLTIDQNQLNKVIQVCFSYYDNSRRKDDFCKILNNNKL